MKMIHCADIHLDSAMTAHIDPETARNRRGELLRNFERMVEYASSVGVGAILIAGDLFDDPNISELTRNTLLHCMTSNPAVAFFYLRGNHDGVYAVDRLNADGKKPDNLFFFRKGWSCYERGGLAIYGAELSGADGDFYEGLKPDPDKINIVMLHGLLSEYPDSVEHGLDAKKLRYRNIDYLALGHLHYHSEGRLDDRGVYCYPGCLEGRGFDECDGEHGFILINADENTRQITHSFVPFEKRRYFSVMADVTGCMTTSDIIAASAKALDSAGCQPSSLVRLVLTGELDPDCEKDLMYLSSAFSEKYYFFKVVDETRLTVSVREFALDRSLRGEFVRTVFADDSLSEEDKAAIVRYGLKALAGEEAD